MASSEERVPIDFVVKRHAGKTYLFAVAMREGETTATFTLPDTGDARVEVLGEGRTIEAVGGKWEDRFTGYQVHLYKIPSQTLRVTCGGASCRSKVRQAIARRPDP